MVSESAPRLIETFPKKTEGARAANFWNRYQVNKARFKMMLDSGVQPSCTKGYLSGICTYNNQHSYIKAVYCGKEYCQSCGETGGIIHQRRLSRWIPKAMHFVDDKGRAKMAVLVVTTPESLRAAYMSKEVLQKFRTALQRKLKELGYIRGLARWHFFGSCPTCSEEGCPACSYTGFGTVYKPHLNICINEGYLSHDDLTAFKEIINKFIEKYWRNNFNVIESGNVHYSYTDTAEKIINKIKYITRPTFRNYNRKLATILYGFRGSQTWGKFEDNKEALKSDLVALEKNLCPECIKHGDYNKINWKNGRELMLGPEDTNRITGHVNSKIFGDIYIDEKPPPKNKRTLLSAEDLQIDRCTLKHIEGGYYYYSPPFEEFKEKENPLFYSKDGRQMKTKITIEALAKMITMFVTEQEYMKTKNPHLRLKLSKEKREVKEILQGYITAGEILAPDIIKK